MLLDHASWLLTVGQHGLPLRNAPGANEWAGLDIGQNIHKMAGRIRRQVFQSDPELQQFVLPEVRPTGRQLGVGSYGSVEELEVNGLVCAGKRMHDALLEQGNIGATTIARKYLEECQVRSGSVPDWYSSE